MRAFPKLSIGQICAGLAVGLLALTACQPPGPATTPAPSPPAILTAAPPTPTITPRPIETLPFKPAAIAPRIQLDSWSPDGKLIAYRIPDDPTVTPGYGDALHIASADGSRQCVIQPAPISPVPEQMRYVSWESNDLLLVLDRETLTEYDPCQPSTNLQDLTGLFPARLGYIAGVSPDHSVILFSTDQGYFAFFPETQSVRQLARNVGGFQTGVSWSPDLRHVALAGYMRADSYDESRVWLVNLGTGALDAAIDFGTWGGEGTVPAPTWLDGRHILLVSSRDRGPLLASVDGQVTPLAQLFGDSLTAKCGDRACVSWMWASGAQEAGRDHYHIILWEVSPPDPLSGLMRLYHSEDGLIEALPGDSAWLSPDGRWIVVDQNDVGAAGYARPVEEALVPQGTGTYVTIPFSWSPDGRFVAVFRQEHVAIYRLADGRQIGRWEVREETGLWSPTGDRLAVIGRASTSNHEAIYVIDMPR